MRSFYILIVVVLQFSFMNAQTSVQTLQAEIDQTVWKPFQQAFQALDGAALNAIYANQVLRVTPAGIDTENTFKQSNLKRFAENKEAGDTITPGFLV